MKKYKKQLFRLIALLAAAALTLGLVASVLIK